MPTNEPCCIPFSIKYLPSILNLWVLDFNIFLSISEKSLSFTVGLITKLREILEQTSRKALLEADKDEAEFLQEKLQKVPYPIYIG